MATNPLIDRIMDQLRLRLPGAMDGITQIELWNTVYDFLNRTNVWLENTEVKLKPEKYLFDIDSPVAGATIKRLMQITNEDGSVFPIKAWIPVPGTLQIASTVGTEMKIHASVAMATGDPGKRQVYPDMPDWIWSDYYDVFVDGTIARMMSQPAKPYSNPQMASYHFKAFGSGCSLARNQANRGRRFEGQRWMFPQSYNGRLLRRP